jgi:hypothetical protein
MKLSSTADGYAILSAGLSVVLMVAGLPPAQDNSPPVLSSMPGVTMSHGDMAVERAAGVVEDSLAYQQARLRPALCSLCTTSAATIYVGRVGILMGNILVPQVDCLLHEVWCLQICIRELSWGRTRISNETSVSQRRNALLFYLKVVQG